jgi:hypothetical protein
MSRLDVHPRNLAPAQTMPWRDWYNLQSWRARAKHQLRLEPLCALCLEAGRTTPATIADHHPRHGGDYNKFVLGPLRSLGDDGMPTDPRHPFNAPART